ncbi:MAG: DNA polymerase I [Erysipelotrichales bacterium]|nr:DNA polymerase I [Erysipelotrichales bacterium]
MKKIIIIDGNSLLFRAYFATFNPNAPLMRAKDGTPTNAIFAFSNMLSRIVNGFKGEERLLVVFDTGKKTFRHQELDTYKANRKPVDKELIEQMPIARELLSVLGIYTYELEGFEGDDIAGTAAKLAQKEGYEVSIYTSDKDFLQLIDKHIKVNLIKKGLSDIKIMDEETLMSEMGLRPSQIPDYKGLMGDSSDNLKGIPGIGQKTAVKLLNELDTLENIIEEAKNRTGKIYTSIIENQESGKLCKHLAEIKTDLTLPFSLEDTIYNGFDFNKLSEFCKRYDLKTLMNKMNQKFIKSTSKIVDIQFIEVNRIPNFDDKIIGIALNYDETDYYNSHVDGIAISTSNNIYYITSENAKNDEKLKEIIESNEIKKCCYDFKAIKVALSKIGFNLTGIAFDVLIASYIIDSSLNSNIDAVFNFFSTSLTRLEEENLNLFSDNSKAIKRTCEISFNSLRLKNEAERQIKDLDLFELYQNIELPLTDVLAKMEIEGFPLDAKQLQEIGQAFKDKQIELENKIYDIAGEKFNIASPKQISELLVKLGVFEGDKKFSTSVDVLKKVADKHEVIPLILEYRKYAKLTSTYIDGLIVHIHSDGKLHPKFNQAETTTGRLSSSNPNLQNISVRDEEGKLIRKAFFYNDDNYILSFDYSQVELRVLAALSNCTKLIDAFNNDEDIHEATAKHVFKKNEITSADRRKAKAVNFGIVYGISDWGLSEQLDISAFEAREIIKSFYETYPEIKYFMSNIITNAEKDGCVKTIFGRIRYLREIHDPSYQVREFAKRAATNAPIQGTAADLIKMAMVNIDKMLTDNHFKTKLVLQIHDELIFKVPRDELEIVSERIKYLMEQVYPKLPVKLKVDGSYAKTWYDAK